MASSSWKIVLAVVLIVAVVVGLELAIYRNPGIYALASKWASDTNLPIWLVGLAAPLVYAWKRLFGDGTGSGSKLEALERDNARLKEEQARLRQELSSLDAWRQQEISRQRQEIARLQVDIDSLNGRISANDRKLASTVQAPASSFVEGWTDEQIEAQARALDGGHE